MKRLISSLAVAFTFVLLAVSPAMAEHYWTLDMFRPTGAVTGSSFTVEYKVFSIEKNDDFSVSLFQNDAVIATQNTTKDYGDSGVFSVTVPGPGTYRYHVSAQSSVDGGTKTTEDRTLSVASTPEGTVTTVFVNNQANAVPAAAGGAAGQAGGAAGAAGGEVAGAAAQPGQVNAAGQANTENGDVLGTEKKTDDKKNEQKGSNNNWLWAIPAALVAAGAAGYYYIQRSGNNPFNRGS